MEELPEESVERFARVAKLLKTQRTLPAKLESVAAIAKRTVHNCDAVGISLLVDGEHTTSAVSDRLAVEVDLVQYHPAKGRVLRPSTTGRSFGSTSSSATAAFPVIAPGAMALDIHSVLSVPLRARDRALGALNLYSRLLDAFDARAEQAAQPLADYAGEVVGTSALYAYALEMVDGLVESLESQAIIGQRPGSSQLPSS